jgi:2-dehydro-3-deoxyphosphogluconate aldolase / (4S)-4-hydroxy-2-oxoglutarate aldolase
MTARNAGFMVQKFYSSTPAGGVTLLKLLHGVFPDVNFVPSGALTSDLAAEYLRLPNVAAVAGSWPELQALFVQGDWPRVETWARAVAQLKRT